MGRITAYSDVILTGSHNGRSNGGGLGLHTGACWSRCTIKCVTYASMKNSEDATRNGAGFDPNHLTARDVLFIVPLFFVIFIGLIFARGMFGQQGYVRWVGLAVNTAVLFGLFIWQSRTEGLRRSFWVLCATCMMIHLAVFIALTHFIEWRIGWYLLMYLEIPILNSLRRRFV